jgi:hypothetical protein
LAADDLDDNSEEAEANRLDTLVAPAADILADDFTEIFFPNAPPIGPFLP